MTPRLEQRPCEHCGRPFTWNSHYPTRRFCDPRCKAAGARDHKNARRRELRRIRKAAARQADARTRAGSHADHDDHESQGNHENRLRLAQANAIQPCPHCRQPVAVFNLLLTPQSAHVDTSTRRYIQ